MAHRASSVIAAAVAAVAVVVVAAGCSSAAPPPPPTPAQAVRNASAATLAAGTARASFDVRTTVAGQNVAINGNGVVDVARNNADLRVRVPRVPELHEVVIGTTAYLELPPALASRAGGKPWGSIDLTKATSQATGGAVSSVGSGNPSDTLALLDRLSDDTRVVGNEPVDGVASTHYTGTLDLNRPVPGEDPARTATIDRVKTLVSAPTLPIDVWVGDGGKLRRQDLTISTAARPGVPAASVVVSIKLSDFGTPFTATAPPPEQVSDLTSTLSR